MTDHPDSTIRPEQVSQFDLPAARAERGWTQDELADQLGVTARTIRTWERTGRVPRTRRPAITRAFTSSTGVDLEHSRHARTAPRTGPPTPHTQQLNCRATQMQPFLERDLLDLTPTELDCFLAGVVHGPAWQRGRCSASARTSASR